MEHRKKNKKQIFIINGSGGVGKDTFVTFIKNEFDQPVINFSSVDKVKEIAKIIGWKGTKTEKDRKFLSDLKLLCSNYNNMPFDSLSEKVEHFMTSSNAALLFLHIREPEEIEKVRKTFEAKTILVKRDSIKQIISNMADKNVFKYQYDIVIKNNGSLDDLKKKSIEFINDLKNETIKSEY